MTAFWLTVQVGRRRVPLPLPLLLPPFLLADLLILVALTVFGIRSRSLAPALVGATLPLTRLLVNLLLHGGRLNISVRGGDGTAVRLFGGWRWR